MTTNGVKDQDTTPPDGGYGWIIVLASFFVHLFSIGVLYSFGSVDFYLNAPPLKLTKPYPPNRVFFQVYVEYFDASAGSVAWVGSVGPAVMAMMASYAGIQHTTSPYHITHHKTSQTIFLYNTTTTTTTSTTMTTTTTTTVITTRPRHMGRSIWQWTCDYGGCSYICSGIHPCLLLHRTMAPLPYTRVHLRLWLQLVLCRRCLYTL